MLAVFDRLEDQFACNTVAADQLDDDIHFRIGHNRECIVSQATSAARHLARQLKVLVRHHRNFDGATGTTRDFLGIAPEDGIGSPTDSSDAQQTNVHCLHFNAFLKQNDAICIPSRK